MTTPVTEPGAPVPGDPAAQFAARNGSGVEGAVLAALERIERRLARLESSAARVDAAAAGAPALVATVADTFDGIARRAGEAGIDVDERARAALHLLERLTAPEVAGPLAQLLAHADVLRSAVALLQQAPALLATAADAADGLAARLGEQGVSVDERGRALLSLLERVSRAEAVASVHGLLDSGLLAPGAISVLSNLAQALPSDASHAPQPVGAWGAYRALREPEVQRALGFLLGIARRLGASLQPRQLPAR